jgi:hypothetical protein
MKQQNNMKDFQIPCIIGTTGHRDLIPEQVNDIKKHVKEIIEEQLDKYPNTPVVVLSPLAEGGDTVVAQVAIELKSKEEYKDRIQLYIPLPLKKELYVEDFKADALLEFESLLRQSDKNFELDPHLDWDGADESKLSIEVDPSYSTERNIQYAQVGAFVARHSNILIAIWDGGDNQEVGGTVQIVKYMTDKSMILCEYDKCLSGEQTKDCDKYPRIKLPAYLSQTKGIGFGESGELRHIKVDRRSSKDLDLTEVSLREKSYSQIQDLSDKTKGQHNLLLEEVEDHNIQVNELISKNTVSSEAINESKEYFYKFDDNKFLEPVRKLFSFFDAAAIRQQAQHKRGQLINVIIVFISFSLTEIYDKFDVVDDTKVYVLTGLLLSLMVLLVHNTYITIKKYKKRFIRNRLCAEIIRSEVALIIYGLKDSISMSSHFVSPIATHVVLWSKLQIDANQNGQCVPDIKRIEDLWIKDQINYANGKTMKEKFFKSKLFSGLYISFMLVSFTFLIFNTLINIIIIDDSISLVKEYSVYILPLMIASMAISIFFNRVLNIFEYKNDVEQNDELELLYLRAQNQINNNKNNNKIIKQTLLELSGLVSNIQYQWNLKHKDSSIDELGPFSNIKNVARLSLIISLFSLIIGLWLSVYQSYLYLSASLLLIISIYLFTKKD